MRLPLTPPRSCRYPLWGDERPTHRHCRRATRPGSPYCPEHHARCYVKLPVQATAPHLAELLAAEIPAGIPPLLLLAHRGRA